MSEYKNVLVVCEQRDGQLQNVSLELIGKARDLANDLESKVIAAIIGKKVQNLSEELIKYGADEVYYTEDDKLEKYLTEPYVKATVAIINELKPEVVLFGATTIGRDLAPRVSARVGCGLTADCTKLEIDEESKNLMMTRPAFGGNLMATILCEDFRPQMATVRPGVMQALDSDASRKGEVEEIKVDFTDADMNVKVLDIAKQESHKKDITEAKILVSGGRGIGGPEGFKPLQELADKLEAEISASRASVDSGWITKDHQVGQTGKTVRPELYFAMGISGAIQHVAGMEDSDLIIAVNKDPEAAIFEIADLGVVGDINAVVPKLIESIEREQKIKAEI